MAVEEESQERRYRWDTHANTFTKMEIPPWANSRGVLIRPWRSQQRLINEFLTLDFISSNTTIPVPKPLRLEFLDGHLSLTTELIDGVIFDDLPPHLQSTSYLDEYVRTEVLPQLRALRSNSLGTTNGLVIPPRRVFDPNPKDWQSRTSAVDEYTLIHGDLAQHNFMCDRDTGEVKAIIDWEYAGFYPDYFEACYWHHPYYEKEDDPAEVEKLRNFLDQCLCTDSEQKCLLPTDSQVASLPTDPSAPALL
ncbi:hypothetical protein A1O3_06133 [Capronia epimyces CBS 606.96]|uniref:Aminoglycoside phosphotransferase domain-containing protein n=1 Tax=Capronia epimyces CBS 606.96 TaxID=1182542 RepID=W9XY55_9EURO|nr:uncharacterized protein A1O3_06133 [Capronia epimyces CBS 606.96]EXJ82320.1 hypothetical protein A1O3_06133 [Capronia epimyces CBS 606.96]